MANKWVSWREQLPPTDRSVLVLLYDKVSLGIYCYSPPKTENGFSYFSGYYPGGLPLENTLAWRDFDDLIEDFNKENNKCLKSKTPLQL